MTDRIIKTEHVKREGWVFDAEYIRRGGRERTTERAWAPNAYSGTVTYWASGVRTFELDD